MQLWVPPRRAHLLLGDNHVVLHARKHGGLHKEALITVTAAAEQ